MEFDRIMERMDELVSSVFDRSYLEHLGDVQWKPAVDVYESADYILVVAELAGISPERVSVSMEGNVLTISGVRTDTAPKKDAYTCHHMEMLCGPFSRKVTINPHVRGDIEAAYESGLLKVRIYKDPRPGKQKEPK